MIRRHRVEGMLPVNASEMFFEEDWQKAFEGCDTTASFIRMTLRGADGKKVLSDEVFYPVYPKEQRLPRAEIACRKVKKGGVVELTLKSRVLARDVFVEVPLQGRVSPTISLTCCRARRSASRCLRPTVLRWRTFPW